MSVLFDARTIAAMLPSLMEPFGTGRVASLPGADFAWAAGELASFGVDSAAGLLGSIGRKKRQLVEARVAATAADTISVRRANIAISVGRLGGSESCPDTC